MYGCESWTIKKAECWRIDAFELWCWRLLRVPWTARRSNQCILKEISPEYALEGLVLKLKLQYFGHLMQRTWLIGKDPDSGKDWRQEEKGTTEDKMARWHHRLNGHEFEQAPWVCGQGSLACCSPWDHEELDTTEQLNKKGLEQDRCEETCAPGAQWTAGAWRRGCLVGIVLERLAAWVLAMKQEGTGEQILQPLSAPTLGAPTASHWMMLQSKGT